MKLQQECELVLERFGVPAVGIARVVASGAESVGVLGERKDGSGIAVTEQDLWHIGSCTKSMTATLLARYVDRGELEWEAPLAPLFAEHGYEPHPDFAELTLRHLLTHRAGMPTDPSAAAAETIGGGAPVWDQRAAFTQAVLAEGPNEPPGKAEFAYTNLGYIVAGALLEAITSTAWEDLMRAEVFAPLGLTTADFGAPGGTSRGALARMFGRAQVTQPWGHLGAGKGGYSALDPDDEQADGPAMTGPAGTVHMSLPDLARYLALHVSRGATARGYLKPKTIDYLHTPLPGEEYALGWYAVGPEGTGIGKSAIWHEGTNNAWYTGILAVPGDRRGMAWVCNACPESILDPSAGMVATALQEIYPGWVGS
jgi:CubicO group peptidase (beta-lactamase class C family)